MSEQFVTVPVEQCDRDAAISTVYDDGSHGAYMMIDGIASGGLDDAPLVQAFARHRLSASPHQDVRGEGERREAAKQALRRWHRDTCYPDASDVELSIGLDAILALSAQPTPSRADVLEAVDPELVERVRHVADAVGKDRHWKAASLTGHDWRRIAAALATVEPAPVAAPVAEGVGG